MQRAGQVRNWRPGPWPCPCPTRPPGLDAKATEPGTYTGPPWLREVGSRQKPPRPGPSSHRPCGPELRGSPRWRVGTGQSMETGQIERTHGGVVGAGGHGEGRVTGADTSGTGQSPRTASGNTLTLRWGMETRGHRVGRELAPALGTPSSALYAHLPLQGLCAGLGDPGAPRSRLFSRETLAGNRWCVTVLRWAAPL